MGIDRHAICHGCTDIIRVNIYIYFFLGGGVNFCSEHIVFVENSVFVEFHGPLVTHLVTHMFTLSNPILAIPNINILRVI